MEIVDNTGASEDKYGMFKVGNVISDTESCGVYLVVESSVTFNLIELNTGCNLYDSGYGSLRELADHAYKSSYRLVHARLILS